MLRRLALAALGLTVGVGLLHAPSARKLLARAGIRWGCPMQVGSPSEVEAAWKTAARQQRGTVPATQRPAAGLALGVTTRAEAQASLAGHGVSCAVEERGFRFLRCEHVPAEVIGERGAPVEQLTLAFDGTDRLLSVDVWRSHLSELDGARAFDALAAALRVELGEPSVEHGEADASRLATPLYQASAEYRYSDYLAKLSVTNLPGKGIAVREQFSAL